MYIFQESFDEEEKLIDKLNISNKYHLYNYLEKRIFNTMFLLYKSIRFIILKKTGESFAEKNGDMFSTSYLIARFFGVYLHQSFMILRPKIIFLENSSGLLHVQCSMSWRYFVF